MSAREEAFMMAEKVPRDPQQPNLPVGISDLAIGNFERRTGLRTPGELREWLHFTNGPRIGAGGVFGIEIVDEWLDIEYYYRPDLYPEWLERGWIPVASDGCGDYYVIATHTDDGPGHPVLFLDQGTQLSRPEYVVASDLWHFLRSYLGTELGERGWPFDREMVLARDPGLSEYITLPKPWETA